MSYRLSIYWPNEVTLTIIKMTSEGASIKEIAERLKLKYNTVKEYKQRLIHTLQAKNMYHVITIAYRKHWIS